jgi:glucose/arabinose dehydrogenase
MRLRSPGFRPLVRRTLPALAVLATALTVTVPLALPCPAKAATTELVAGGLNRPVYVTGVDYAGVGRLLYIVEQPGVIRVMVDGVLQGTPFLDIDALVPDISGTDERGLLGLALDPDFQNSGVFYVDYINLSSNSVIARYHIQSGNPLLADASSAEVVLTQDQPYTNHNGGCLQFGPDDGYLYIGFGDGGSAGDPGNRAQNGMVLLGKILRIDVNGVATYTIPPDNPFVGNPNFLDEIWAYGVRNPWRYSFDRQTSDLWIADVGQNAWEEVDFEPASDPGGHNYGWRLLEGTHCYNPPTDCDPDGVTTLPIYEYPHPTGYSITGGYVYRGAAIPSFQGEYFFADYVTSKIWSLHQTGLSVVVTDRTLELAPTSGSINSISSFGQDPDGELYICDRGGTTTGEVWKIIPDPTDVAGRPLSGDRLQIGLDSPNPFGDRLQFRVNALGDGPVSVGVINVEGQRVRDLAPAGAATGEHAFTWDGKDDAGRTVPSGVYFLRAGQGNQQVSRRIDFLR